MEDIDNDPRRPLKSDDDRGRYIYSREKMLEYPLIAIISTSTSTSASTSTTPSTTSPPSMSRMHTPMYYRDRYCIDFAIDASGGPDALLGYGIEAVSVSASTSASTSDSDEAAGKS